MPAISTPDVIYTVTTTVGLDYPAQGHVSGLGATFHVITSTITGTWTFLLNYVDPGGTVIPITTVSAGITTATATNLVLAAPFALTSSTPLPNQVVVTESVAGTTTARFLISWNQ